jgi:hypothetical protein
MFGRGDIERCPVAVVNEQAADVLSDGDPVGRRITDASGHHVEIIGVVTTLPARADDVVAPQIFFDGVTQETPIQQSGPSVFRVPILLESSAVGMDTNAVSASYVSAMNMAMVTGRSLSEDDGPGKCRVGVINQEAADRYFGGHALGGAVIDGDGRRTEVVGIVSTPLLRATQRDIEPMMFTSMMQDFAPRMSMLLATRTATGRAARDPRSAGLARRRPGVRRRSAPCDWWADRWGYRGVLRGTLGHTDHRQRPVDSLGHMVDRSRAARGRSRGCKCVPGA